MRWWRARFQVFKADKPKKSNEHKIYQRMG